MTEELRQENEALHKQVLELSAQVEMMREVPDEGGLLPCPHCGGKPRYSGVEEYDDRRYMRMTLTCCAEYEAALSYGTYRHLTKDQIKERLTKSLQTQFNERAISAIEPSAALQSYVNEEVAKAMEEARTEGLFESGGEEYLRTALMTWKLLDEVECARSGIGLTHIGEDPVVFFRDKYHGLLPREFLEAGLRKVLQVERRNRK